MCGIAGYSLSSRATVDRAAVARILIGAHGIRRHDRRATVDSEAICALVARYPRSPAVLDELHGSMACAWLDERFPGRLFLARGLGRPLWLGLHRDGVFFASTRDALSLLEELSGVRVAPLETAEGRWLEVQSGRLVAEEAFTPDRTYLPVRVRPCAVRPRPHDLAGCMSTLSLVMRPGEGRSS